MQAAKNAKMRVCAALIATNPVAESLSCTNCFPG